MILDKWATRLPKQKRAVVTLQWSEHYFEVGVENQYGERMAVGFPCWTREKAKKWHDIVVDRVKHGQYDDEAFKRYERFKGGDYS